MQSNTTNNKIKKIEKIQPYEEAIKQNQKNSKIEKNQSKGKVQKKTEIKTNKC